MILARIVYKKQKGFERPLPLVMGIFESAIAAENAVKENWDACTYVLGTLTTPAGGKLVVEYINGFYNSPKSLKTAPGTCRFI